MQFNTIFIIW